MQFLKQLNYYLIILYSKKLKTLEQSYKINWVFESTLKVEEVHSLPKIWKFKHNLI